MQCGRHIDSGACGSNVECMYTQLVFWTCVSSNVGLYIDHSSSVVGHTCMMCEAYLFRGICQ